ncbi:MAG: rhomboid family intramembrane serine protease [Chloroflexi bacterium]|nr:rhomboid family intramembrane serine protease [Chloroflexota bacterium]
MAFLWFLVYVLVALFFASFFFPLPLADVNKTMRYRTIPWMTGTLIGLNVAIFLLWQAPDIYRSNPTLGNWFKYFEKIWLYGYRESYLREGKSIGAFVAFTSIFMHGDLFHLISNMIYLWAFGYRVEDACGPWRFLSFYILCGMTASMGNILFNPLSQSADIPSIGASGAISGVLGAYLILFYGEWVTCLWGLGSFLRMPVVLTQNILNNGSLLWWRWTTPLPAWLFLIVYLAMNVVPSFEIIQEGQDVGGVGYLAHIVGFLSGLTVFLFVRKDLLMRYAAGRAL